MASLGKGKKIALIVVGVLLTLGAVQYINWFVYPFSSAKPNFADVEAVYNKMQIPSTWTKTGEGANKGIAGRQCGIESNGCFSKSVTFAGSDLANKDTVFSLMETSGCISPVYKDETYKGDTEGSKYSYHCMSGGVKVGATVDVEKKEIFILTSSK